MGVLTSPKGFKVSNLMFVDDCLIFAKSIGKAARNILQVLNDFANVVGQKINSHKSSLYFSNTTPNQVKNDVKILQIQHKTTIGKYLEKAITLIMLVLLNLAGKF